MNDFWLPIVVMFLLVVSWVIGYIQGMIAGAKIMNQRWLEQEAKRKWSDPENQGSSEAIQRACK